MVEEVKRRKSILTEMIDQIAHAAAGIVLMYLVVLFPVLGVALLVMLIGLARDLHQHKWQDYGAMDMVFWGVGCGLFTVAYYVVGVPDLETIKALITAWQA